MKKVKTALVKDQSNNKPLFEGRSNFPLFPRNALFYSVRFIKTNIVGETQSLFIMILTENRKLFEGILIKSR